MNRWRAWAAVLVLSACNALALLDRQALNLLAQPIKSHLLLSDLQIGLLQGPAFALFYALLGVPFGRMADLTVRTRLIAMAVAGWSLSTAAFGLAQGFAGLFIARACVAVGEAALVPAAYSLLADLFEKRTLGRAMAVFVTGAVLGSGGGMMLGGALHGFYEHDGAALLSLLSDLKPWQATFLTIGLPGLLVAALVWITVPEPQRRGASARDKPPFAAVLALIWTERRFYLPAMGSYLAMSVIVYGFFGWAPTYLIREFDSTPAQVGRWFGLVALISGMTSPVFFGWLADRLYSRWGVTAAIRVLGALLVAIGLLCLIAFRGTTLREGMLGIAVLTVLITGPPILATLSIQMAAPALMRGQITAIVLLLSSVLSATAGPVFVPALAQHASSSQNLGVAIAWVVGCFAMMGAAACASTRPPRAVDT